MSTPLLKQSQRDPAERSGSAIAAAAVVSALAVWALASISVRLEYTRFDPVMVGFVCAAAAGWHHERFTPTAIAAACGTVAGIAGLLVGNFIAIDLIPWLFVGAGVALATAWPVGLPVRTIAAVPAGALAAAGGFTIGTYVLPVAEETMLGYGFADLSEPLAALSLVAIASLISTRPGGGKPKIYVARYHQKGSRHR